MYHDKGLVTEAEMSKVMTDVTTLDKQGKKDLKAYQDLEASCLQCL
jgi:hypothetical protein